MLTDKLPWKVIAFVADVMRVEASGGRIDQRDDLDKTEPQVLEEVIAALFGLGFDVKHFESPSSLAAAAGQLHNALVLSTYAGERSRNRLTLVPAIAESFGLDFVGLDAMGQALAHDKEVMKRIAQDCGLTTPSWRVLRDAAAAKTVCEEFPIPFVIKPLAEGSSIGITQRNLIWQPNEGLVLVRELLNRFQQPVLIEGFAGGREVSFVSIEAAPRPHQGFVEVVVDGEPDFFSTRLFDADEKLNRRLPRSIRRIDEALNSDDKAAIEQLLDAIGHYGFVRIDGKLGVDGRFVFLELTSDPWLGVRGHLAQAFILQGWTYPEVIWAILASARLAPRGQLASG